jgi:purine-nucleoside phosphorylase
MAMDGRLHCYEGCAPWQVTFPIRLMHALGIEVLVVSNASGGLNPRLRLGDIVVIEDHINLMGAKRCHDLGAWPCRAPLLGKRVYDLVLMEHALAVARRRNMAVQRGVYAAMMGPSYETRAEYRFLRRIGADVVGMSTVPEVLAAARLGVRVLALSAVTNVARPDAPVPTRPEMVVSAARQAEPRLREVVLGVLREIGNDEGQ